MLKAHLVLSVNLLVAMRRAWEKRDLPDESPIVVDPDGRLRLAFGRGLA
jgi:hypothetical protein